MEVVQGADLITITTRALLAGSSSDRRFGIRITRITTRRLRTTTARTTAGLNTTRLPFTSRSLRARRHPTRRAKFSARSGALITRMSRTVPAGGNGCSKPPHRLTNTEFLYPWRGATPRWLLGGLEKDHHRAHCEVRGERNQNHCFHDHVVSGALKCGAVPDFPAYEPQNAAPPQASTWIWACRAPRAEVMFGSCRPPFMFVGIACQPSGNEPPTDYIRIA